MAQKFFMTCLRPIQTYTEGPQIFKKIVIALVVVVLFSKKKSNRKCTMYTAGNIHLASRNKILWAFFFQLHYWPFSRHDDE